MAELNVKRVNISDLIEYDMNPRMNDKAVGAVEASIKKFGYTNPIIVNAENVILCGHTRLKALRNQGESEVEVIEVTHLSEQQEKAFRIADNRVADFAEWDGDLLEAEMQNIEADDWELFGFKEKDVQKIRAGKMCTCPKCGESFERA